MGSCLSSNNDVDISRHGRKTLQVNLVQKKNKLEENYNLSGRNLGEGTSTNIKEATMKKYTKTERTRGVAIKLYNGKAEIQPDLKQEAQILGECDHPNIVKLYEVARVGKQLSLVLELCKGGPLLNRKPFKESEASHIVRQLCSAIKYLHSKHIVHRDIECSNIMFATTAKDSDIKLIDFGSATKLDLIPNKPGAFRYLKEKTGSMHVMAPEVIRQRYGVKADIWSLGIVTYMILNEGQMPITGSSIQEVERKILQGSIDYRGWKHSSEAKNFLMQTCMVNAGLRLTADAASKHPWVEKIVSKKNVRLPNELVMSFELFRMAKPLKRIGLNVLARKSPPTTYVQLWRNLDTTKSNTLTRNEFMEGFKNSGISEEELTDLFEKLDVNFDGEILYTEFVAAALENDGVELEEAQIQEAFDLISKKTTFITKKHIESIVGIKHMEDPKIQARSKAEIEEIFKTQTKIDYESFARLFEHGFNHTHYLSEIIETSLDEDQLSKLKQDELDAHMSTIVESC